MNENQRSMITGLRKESGIAHVACVDEDNFPLVRAMLVLEHESLKCQYFSTNTSSQKVAFFEKHPKASVYYCDEDNFKGVLFIGEMQICTDQATKDFLWREGFERYYSKGVTDPDYCVLKFTADKGKLYHHGNSTNFSIEEFE